MIAEVYPIKRQSRTLGAFDYLVPDAMTLARGDLVRVPYRHEHLCGVVKRLKDKPPRGIRLKTIEKRYDGTALKEAELSFFEWLAKDLCCSVSTVLLTAIHVPPTRSSHQTDKPIGWLPTTLPRSEAPIVMKIVEHLTGRPRAFIQTPDLRRATAVILGYVQTAAPNKTLILVPTVRDAQLLCARLPGVDPILITGEETEAQRFTQWEGFRSRAQGVMVGTRCASLMLDQTVNAIFMLRSGDESYIQSQRNPRFETARILWERHKRFGASLFLMDVVPTSSILDHFEPTEIFRWTASAPVQVINARKDPSFAGVGFESMEAISEILEREGRILCIHNQKGLSRSLVCGVCGRCFACPQCDTALTAQRHTLECARCRQTQPLPLRCDCGSQRLIGLGKGNEEIAQELKDAYPDTSIQVIDKDHPKPLDASITIVTDYYHEAIHHPFLTQPFDLVIATGLDAPLFHPNPGAMTAFARSLWQWHAVAMTAHAPFLIQTSSPELVERVFADPLAIAQEERASRRDFHLPPTVRWVRIVLKEDEPHKATMEMEALEKTLATIDGVHVGAKKEQPGVGRLLEVGIDASRYVHLQPIFAKLPDRYIIDTTLHA